MFLYSKPNDDLKYWVRIDFMINSQKIVNNDSINRYFSFYVDGEKIRLKNKIPIDILSIDSIVVQYDSFILKTNNYLSYSNNLDFIRSLDGDTLDFDCFFYSDFKKSFGNNSSLPDSLKFYGLILDNIYIGKEYR
jgi:hypothetical protein